MIQIYKVGNSKFETNGDAVLEPTVCDCAMELNGVWETTLTHTLDNEERWKMIEEEAVISAPSYFSDKQLYRIYDVEKDSNIVAKAMPIFLDSAKEIIILDKRPTNVNGQGALDSILSGQSKYTGESDITKASTAYYIRKNPINAISSDDEQSFVNRWGGEIMYDNYKVVINERLGSDKGLRCELGYNATGISSKVNTESIATRIVPVAYNGHTLGGDTPWVDSPLIGEYPIIHTATIDYPDVKLKSDSQDGEGFDTIEELRAELVRLCELEFENGIDKPQIQYDCNLIDLAKTQEYSQFKQLETICLGDNVVCKNKILNINTNARAIQVVFDCINKVNKSVKLGDYMPSFFDVTSDLTSRVEKAINANGTVIAEEISGVINALNASMRAQKDVSQRLDFRAVLMEDFDIESPTYGAMSLGTQGLQLAKERNETNTDWKWGTAIDFQSVDARYLIAGIIADRLGLNFWNLDTGEIETDYMKADHMTATNAEVTGKITTASGKIGNWEIAENGIVSRKVEVKPQYTAADAEDIKDYLIGTKTLTPERIAYLDVWGKGYLDSQAYVAVRNISNNLVGTEWTYEYAIDATSPYRFVQGSISAIGLDQNFEISIQAASVQAMKDINERIMKLEQA